ncbi:hypothetical protein RRG08_038147 [Elysia crispata]|uniref:Uncharacterized protein n=1 Tax=Elysia crispata TaxID=231223 RepID=A0AAE1DP33_9GAST|nr:hypothetical protein RRG08_038147 [Elysia crispata]
MLSGNFFLSYGVFAGQFVRDALFKKIDGSMITEQLSLAIIPGLWTLGLGLAMALLSAIIIDKNAKGRCFWSGWLLKSVKRLSQVSLPNKGKQRLIEKKQEFNKNEEKSIDSFTNHQRDESPPFSTHLHNNRIMALEKPQMVFDLALNTEHVHLTTDVNLMSENVVTNENANFSSNDIRSSAESQVPCDQNYFGNPDIHHEICLEKSGAPAYSCEKNSDYHNHKIAYLCSVSKTSSSIEPKAHQTKSAQKALQLSGPYAGILPYVNQSGSGDSNCSHSASAISSSLTCTENESTQTYHSGVFAALSLTRGTMTDAFTTDSCVSTHGKPCRLVRHYSTSTTGPFMKKLRRAYRLLIEARKTSRFDQASSISKWRKVLERYKHKMQSLTSHLTKKDEMMGGTSSRISVLRAEIKDALLAVRSTKERLTTQCKLNAALMDVIESKSENPTYGADLDHHGSGLKQEQRGPQ